MLSRADRHSIALTSLSVVWLFILSTHILFQGPVHITIPELWLLVVLGWAVPLTLAGVVALSGATIEEWGSSRGGRAAFLAIGEALIVIASSYAASRTREVWPLILAVMTVPLFIPVFVRILSRTEAVLSPAEVRDVDVDAGGRQRVLINIPTPGYQEGRIRVVVVQSPSNEQVYALRVEPHATTCRDAVAWTFDRDARTFAPAVLT